MAAVGGTATEESIARLRVAVLRLARALRTTSTREGLSPTETAVLATLLRRGETRVGDLAAAEALHPTMLSRVLARLEDAGLVARTVDAADRRVQWARATPAGRRLVARLRSRHAALLAERLDRLSPEQLDALMAALEPLEILAAEGAAERA